ncbi:hypothetical protein EYF80_038832 [Liparis tanakae]|uniref:Uncharacterized protein n=1 Tax=Liparis tanakae TaxID=230148 RepID=A0A4Z2GC59_9TELE|nr:hypothetical protein EYF80_038832 [Liparis tanakae]
MEPTTKRGKGNDKRLTTNDWQQLQPPEDNRSRFESLFNDIDSVSYRTCISEKRDVLKTPDTDFRFCNLNQQTPNSVQPNLSSPLGCGGPADEVQNNPSHSQLTRRAAEQL